MTRWVRQGETDVCGRTHRLWLLGPGAGQDAVLAAVAHSPPCGTRWTS
ncbi:MAG: hypothetical protein ACRDSP_06625 [Pseudonocardiaceae bacterium]